MERREKVAKLREVRDGYAERCGYDDWDDLSIKLNGSELNYHNNQVTLLFAENFNEIMTGTYKKCDKEPKMNHEFYMVTCRGVHGAKVRHESFERAVSEAKRIAKKEQHQTWIVGVVATVEPKVEVTTELKIRDGE